MTRRRSLLFAAATATLSLLLALSLVTRAETAAGAAESASFASSSSTPGHQNQQSTSTSTSTFLHRRRQRRRPHLGPRKVTGVVRRATKENIASSPSPSPSRDLLSRCRELWRDATLDHFSGWKPKKSADVVVADADDDKGGFGKKQKHHHRRRSTKTFKQRYFVCDDEWAGPGSPIFFYFGNEADVTLYLNATGLMWENAASFGAALVFAEHRGYGLSRLPSLRWLTADQAMADYAELITELRNPDSGILRGSGKKKKKNNNNKKNNDDGGGGDGDDVDDASASASSTATSSTSASTSDAAVIGFGGSYGGMLAAWMRLKYPFHVDGVVAASAPIFAFEGMTPPYDPGAFAAVVTADAGPKGGASEACSGNVREAFRVLLETFKEKEGEGEEEGLPASAAAGVADAADAADVAAALRLCPESARALSTPQAALAVAEWASGAFDSAAMGMYPYPSSYMLNGDAELPAWPMRAICGGKLSEAGLQGVEAVEAFAEGIGVYFNATRDAACYDPLAEEGGGSGSGSAKTDEDGRLWGWQYCTEMFMPFGKSGERDMFYPSKWDAAEAERACEEQFRVAPSPLYAAVEWGGKRVLSPPGALTNAVLSNGLLDPWSTGGVRSSDVVVDDDSRSGGIGSSGSRSGSRSLVVVEIPEGGHHVDLFFSNDADPESVRRAREVERREMRRWVEEAAARRGGGRGKEEVEVE